MDLVQPLYRVPAGAEHFPVQQYINIPGSSGALVTLQNTWVNPNPLPFLVTHVGAFLSPGAAQYPTHAWAEVLFPGAGGVTAAQFWSWTSDSTIAAIARRAGAWVGGILIPPRYFVSVGGQFNAGAASNTLTSTLTGFLVPRGNLGYP